MQTNEDKIAALRRGITAQIVALMKEHGLEELELLSEEELDDPTYILWPSDKGNWYESVVRKVLLCGDDIELHCYDKEDDIDAVLSSAEIDCNPIERLESIRRNILQTLGLEDPNEQAVESYAELEARRKALQRDTGSFILRHLRQNGGRISLTMPRTHEEWKGFDFPVTVSLMGGDDYDNVEVSEVYVEPAYPTIYANGRVGGFMERGYRVPEESYSDVLCFIAYVLNLK